MNLISEYIANNSFSIFLSIFLIYFLIFNASTIFVGRNLKVIKKKKFLSNKNVYLFGGYFIAIPIILLIIYFNPVNFQSLQENIILLLTIILILIFGVLDDNIDLKPLIKTIYSLIVFFIFLIFNQKFRITGIDIYFFKYNFLFVESLFFTIFCFYILQNTINFSDGINGVAILIVFCVNLILFYYNQDKYFAFQIIFFLNILIFTLILNLNNKLFLGDAGVNLISFITAINMITVYNQANSLLTQEKVLLYLLFPGLDLIRLVIERIYNKISPTKKDSNHLHHLLFVKVGQFQTLLIYTLIIIANFIICEIFKIEVFHVTLLLILTYLIILKKFKT